MCGGGKERRARKKAEREARQAREDAARREREAIARAEAQAKRMLEAQRKSYEAMQAMIPKPPPVPKARPASTKVETSMTAPEPKDLLGIHLTTKGSGSEVTWMVVSNLKNQRNVLAVAVAVC